MTPTPGSEPDLGARIDETFRTLEKCTPTCGAGCLAHGQVAASSKLAAVKPERGRRRGDPVLSYPEPCTELPPRPDLAAVKPIYGRSEPLSIRGFKDATPPGVRPMILIDGQLLSGNAAARALENLLDRGDQA